jgi:hypothetical protein
MVNKMDKRYKIKRIVEEFYEVDAANRNEALQNIDDPYKVTIKSENIISVKKLNELKDGK